MNAILSLIKFRLRSSALAADWKSKGLVLRSSSCFPSMLRFFQWQPSSVGSPSEEMIDCVQANYNETNDSDHCKILLKRLVVPN